MSAHDTFAEQFRALLHQIPPHSTLEQWQYDYKQVMFLMGQEIINRFAADAVGPPPDAAAGESVTSSAKFVESGGPREYSGGGQGKGGHPNDLGGGGFIPLPIFVLGMRPHKSRHPR
jgi:hypothetical protein